MGLKINYSNWKRKEHFEFFNSFDDPFFGITTEVNLTRGYKLAKEKDYSVFLYYLHCSLMAANLTESFKYRVINGDIYYFDPLHASPTIDREDETFGFAFMEYKKEFEAFSELAEKEIEAAKHSTGLRLNDDNKRQDVIHFSVVPWFSFTSLSHPRNFSQDESIPKITFGKYYESGSRYMLPVSIHAHHGLMDGYHAGKYLETFQKLLNENQ
jgi:chloramphenicol O-acetyltransferase type A